MKKSFFFPILFLALALGAQSGPVPVVEQLDLSAIPAGVRRHLWVRMGDDGFSRPLLVPVIVIKGAADGPVLGLTAAIHGNELNGIPIIQELFRQVDPATLRGTLVGVPGINPEAGIRMQREFPDGNDLNRVFPGKNNGDDSQQYAYQVFDRIVKHFQYLVDLHTASFGRVNAFYIRADLGNDTLRQMALLQGADIVLNSRGPSAGQQASSGAGTLRDRAAQAGIAGITVESGDPQVFQPELIRRGIAGIRNILVWLNMVDGTLTAVPEPARCRRSYWIYTDAGGLLEVHPGLAQRVAKGDKIATLRNPFGEVIREYVAPEAGIVIGKSTNPVNYSGGRILHLGILEE